jgi:acyl carrier protein
MTSEEIEPRLTEVFRDIFDRDDITLTRVTTSADIEDWDSLANISLMVAIEKEFNVSFSLKEVKALLNVGGMIDLIEAKKA